VVGDLHRLLIAFLPADDIGQIIFRNDAPVKLAQQIFNKDLDGKRQSFN
jgi:hypothetical protein